MYPLDLLLVRGDRSGDTSDFSPFLQKGIEATMITKNQANRIKATMRGGIDSFLNAFGEECVEVAQLVLKHNRYKHALLNKWNTDLHGEIADVLITAFMVIEELGISKEVSEKIEGVIRSYER